MPPTHKLINDDEDVILDLRPHWSALMKPALALAVGAVVTLVLRRVDSYAALLGMVLTLAALTWSVVNYLRWTKTRFIVTTDRVMYSSGVLAKQAIKIPIARINGVSFSQSIIGHFVGAGDLSIQAGGVGSQGTFRRVPRPAFVQDEIYGQVMARAAKTEQGATDVPSPAFGAPASQNGGLRDAGVMLPGGDADAIVDLLSVLEGYARSDLLPDGMAEQIRRRLIETGQMSAGGSVVRDLADALLTISQRVRRNRGANRHAS